MSKDSDILLAIAGGSMIKDIAKKAGVSQTRIHQRMIHALQVLVPGIYRHIIKSSPNSWDTRWVQGIRDNAVQVNRILK